MPQQPAAATPTANNTDEQEQQQPQCRICLDGPDPDLGRLIRPCLCSGTVSHVHVACLQRWRNTSATNVSAFFVCPQCRYRYRFARTKIVGLATNPVAIATLSTIMFTALVYASSFLTTTLLSSMDDPYYDSFSSSSVYFTWGAGYWSWSNPYTVGRDLVRAALRIIQDESGRVFGPDALLTSFASDDPDTIPRHNVFWRFIRRIVLGLPVVGAVSLVHMLISLPLLGPIQWIARSRGNRGRRDSSSRDTAAVFIILLLAIGALRLVYQVYKLTELVTKRVLLRAETSILEVNA